MLQGEHSATLSTFFKIPFAIKIFALTVFEWAFCTGSTVRCSHTQNRYVDQSSDQNLDSTQCADPDFSVTGEGGGGGGGHGHFLNLVRESHTDLPREAIGPNASNSFSRDLDPHQNS